jgi:anti-sigma-K factor RskA
MTAIAKSFGSHHSRTDARNSRSAWRYCAAALAIVLAALIMTALGSRGRSADQG